METALGENVCLKIYSVGSNFNFLEFLPEFSPQK